MRLGDWQAMCSRVGPSWRTCGSASRGAAKSRRSPHRKRAKENAMRRALLTLAALAATALASGTAQAAPGRGGYGGYPAPPSYSFHNYQPYNSWAGRDDSDSFSAGVRRIMANHSRYRYNPHPRSFYKSPPSPYD